MQESKVMLYIVIHSQKQNRLDAIVDFTGLMQVCHEVCWLHQVE